MTAKYFLDSSAIYAIANKTDAAGERINNILLQARPLLFTTNYIFAETLSLITKRQGKHAAIQTGKLLKDSKFVKIALLEKSILTKAWDLFVGYQDKDFDYIDATSFAYCHQQKIKNVLTLDHHFTQMGFQILP